MQPVLMLFLPLLFTLVQTLYQDWPVERRQFEEDAVQNRQTTDSEFDFRVRRHTEPVVFSRERRMRLCGKKIIEQLLIICDSCILPVGSELAKRSVDGDSIQQATRQLFKRELSIATKCCAGQCKMSELEQLCCKKG